jgi:hypothetical protein
MFRVLRNLKALLVPWVFPNSAEDENSPLHFSMSTPENHLKRIQYSDCVCTIIKIPLPAIRRRERDPDRQRKSKIKRKGTNFRKRLDNYGDW